MDTIIVPTPDALAIEAASMVMAEVAGAQRLLLGLAGGSTPKATHDVLCAQRADWSGVIAWIADERWVSPDSPEANQHMVRTSLTNETGITFLAPDTTAGVPAAAANDYGDVIVPLMTDASTRKVVMLGIGTDGHTASLFPGTRALGVTSVGYVANFVPQLDTWRLTATAALIGLADVVMFLVSGTSKAPIIAEIASGSDHPAAAITAVERVVWLLDEAAAADL